MARERTVFVCQSCGAQAARWLGRCADCGEWNTLVEERLAAPPKGGGRAAGERRAAAEPITELAAASERRSSCGIGELDRVLGGGVVPGSVILIGGDPGIGKSTLVLQALAQLARQGKALYVTGEESPQQVKMRADRLGITERTLLVLA
ncbi:MAG TPA: ATPase domain-containing protein, partial [Candidatus Dormibacteraeota bacterium]|nr:ATPase domain-containing protein [Candidatus Dormibacteraeota bacterium]